MRRLARFVAALTAIAACLVIPSSTSHALERAGIGDAADPARPIAVGEPTGGRGGTPADQLVGSVSAIVAGTVDEQTRILDYWTSDRMRDARPAMRRLPKPKRVPIPMLPKLPPLEASDPEAGTAPDKATPDNTTPDDTTPGRTSPDGTSQGGLEDEPRGPDLGPADKPEAAAKPNLVPRAGTPGSLLPEGLLPGVGEPQAAAPQAKAPAPQPAGEPRAARDGGGYPWNGAGSVTRTTGKVFFTLNGTDYVCSASTVRSANRDTVLTAGHCVNNGPGEFATRFIFVPAYRDGQRPYGSWTARRLLTPGPWSDRGDVNYDVGFAVLNAQGGRHVTDVVGAQPIAFNSARGGYRYSFGYPSVGGYNGARLFYCRGTAQRDKYGSQDEGIPCDMTEGSSGGPWLSGFNPANGTGVLTSVNSFGYDDMPNVMFGPYFDQRVQTLFNTAQRA